MPSSRGSSQPREQTRVSSTAGRFFTTYATREVPKAMCLRFLKTQSSNPGALVRNATVHQRQSVVKSWKVVLSISQPPFPTPYNPVSETLS